MLEYVPEGDLYAVLQVAPTATSDEIKRAHRNLIKQHHPDRGGNADRAAALNYARGVLLDQASRREYDELRLAWLRQRAEGSRPPRRWKAPQTGRRRGSQPVSPVPAKQRGQRAFTTGIVTEYLYDDIRDAERNGEWVSAFIMAGVGIWLDGKIHRTVGCETRSAIDALADWLREQRRKRSRVERAQRHLEAHQRVGEARKRVQKKIEGARGRRNKTV